MTAYILRDIDPKLWKRVKIKATQEGVTIKSVIIRALYIYVLAPRKSAHAEAAPDATAV